MRKQPGCQGWPNAPGIFRLSYHVDSQGYVVTIDIRGQGALGGYGEVNLTSWHKGPLMAWSSLTECQCKAGIKALIPPDGISGDGEHGRFANSWTVVPAGSATAMACGDKGAVAPSNVGYAAPAIPAVVAEEASGLCAGRRARCEQGPPETGQKRHQVGQVRQDLQPARAGGIPEEHMEKPP